MARIAFVNMGCSRKKGHYSEPTHLIPMCRICEKAGHQIKLFQWREEEKKIIEASASDIWALSFIGHEEKTVNEVRAMLENIPVAKRPQLIAGGSDVRLHWKYYAQIFSPCYKNANEETDPFLVVTGPGENLMQAIAPVGFNLSLCRSYNWGSVFSVYDNAVIVKPFPLPLNEQDFRRPYQDLFLYGNDAQVKWNQGECQSGCSFCGAEKGGKFEYRDISLILQEVAELKRLGAAHFYISSPNFTASPSKASKIIAALAKTGEGFTFPSRVDSLYFSIKNFSPAWERLREKGDHGIEMGIESFLLQRLAPGRLGKYCDLKQAQLQKERLDHILPFFFGSTTAIEADLILYDWQMTLDELKKEIEALNNYLSIFSPNLRIDLHSLGQILYYAPASPLSKTMRPWDFWAFERDPRVLFIALLMRDKILQLYDVINQHSFYRSMEHIIAQEMIKFLEVCLSKTGELQPKSFEIKPMVDFAQEENSTCRGMLEIFYDQLGNKKDGMKKYFDGEYQKLFPLDHGKISLFD